MLELLKPNYPLMSIIDITINIINKSNLSNESVLIKSHPLYFIVKGKH